jgi:hypothetical protein
VARRDEVVAVEVKLDIVIFANYPDDHHLVADDIEGIIEDIEDVCRFGGGSAVIAVKVDGVEWERPA